MNYRKFGNTGVIISTLGFGCMRLPEEEIDGKWVIKDDLAVPMLLKAYEMGVNYFDSAYGYCHGNSEITVGKALKSVRNKVNISTKIPLGKIKVQGDYRAILEEQLKKLDTDWIDFYHFHGINADVWDRYRQHNLALEAQKAKDEGLIKHISFSFHGKPDSMKKLIDEGIFESVLCQYNIIDRTNEEAIAYAVSKGLGVVVMGPIAGGRLSSPSDSITGMALDKGVGVPETALRFVMGNQNVSCALSGMTKIEMVEQNAEVASRASELYSADFEQIREISDSRRKLLELYCTGCGYCMPCPKNINIPEIFAKYNQDRVYGLTASARTAYTALINPERKSSASPLDCIECGKCEEKCPQNIRIREKIKEAHNNLYIAKS